MTELTRAGAPMQASSPGPPPLTPHRAVTLEDDVLVAASRGQVELLRELLAAGASLQPDKDGRTALHYAAQEGHADTCLYLLSRGCGLDSQDTMGFSPLLRAASQGARDAVQVLLEAGCNVNIQDEHGNAAIHETCWNGFSKTAEMLVHHNCDVFLTNKAGFTALHLAAQNGHNESSRVLLYAGCNPDVKNNYGDTALHTAARYGHAGVARILISARCKLSEQNKNGDSALHIAAALKRRKIAKILVESGTDVELFNKQNETAMDVAKRKEHPEIMLIISTYAKPRPQPQHHHSHHPAVTFKDEIEMVDGPIVCADDQPPLKQEQPSNTRPEKEKKAGFFFSFKRKKKDKSKERSSSAPNTPTTAGQKRLGSGPSVSGKETPAVASSQAEHGGKEQKNSAVHGFFSRYVPRDGVQFYRDLAGNIKQGPIGYAPVCQCGPSLRHLETTLTSTKDSLHQRIDVSHHILSRRIDDIDMRTRPLHMGRRGGYATDTALHQRPYRDNYHTHSYNHHQHRHKSLHDADDDDDEDDYSGDEDYRFENSLDMGIGSRDSRDIMQNGDMPEDLEHWLNDKLASYGHCLNHHHDDSALPPRNLFADFPHSALGMGRLVRSRSDETLSASDYSGKFRKRDFYASRQAAMQQIRGWELPRGNNKTVSRKTKNIAGKHNSAELSGSNKASASLTAEKHNYNHPNSRKVVTEVQVHSEADPGASRLQSKGNFKSEHSNGPGMLSPSTNSTTSPGTLANSSVGVGNKSVPDKVSTPVGHAWHPHSHQQQKPGIYQSGPSGPHSERSRGAPSHQPFEKGNQQMSVHQNPPYPQPPRYMHQNQTQPKNLSVSHSQYDQRDQIYSYHQDEPGLKQEQNLYCRGSPSINQSPSKQENFSSPVLAGHQRSESGDSMRAQQAELSSQNVAGSTSAGLPGGLTRYQDRYGVRYNRALSSDALNDDNNENIDRQQMVPQHHDIQRSRSMDNTIEERQPIPHSSSYSTCTGVRQTTNSVLTPRRLNSPRSSGRESQSLSPAPRATTRYRLPETSSGEASSSSNPQWQPKQSLISFHPSDPTSSLPTSQQGLANADSIRHATSPAIVPSTQNLSDPMEYTDQAHGTRRQYASSVSFNKQDANNIFIGQNESSLPSHSRETSSSLQTSVTQHGPLRECLQHDNNLLSPRLPSTADSNGGKEDSTCSSNQDSGYGRGRSRADRPFGGGTDTSIGTPSSSFSIERSNTPSTAGSPYASQRGNAAAAQMFNTSLHSRMSHSGYLSGRGRTYSPLSSGPDGSFRSSSSESHRPGDGLHKSNNGHGYKLGSHNAERCFSSPSNDSVLSGESAGRSNNNQRNGIPSYANQQNATYSHGDEQNRANSHQIDNGSHFSQSNTQRASGTFTKPSNNVETSLQLDNNVLTNSKPSKNTFSRQGPPPPPKPNIRKVFNGVQNGPSTPYSNNISSHGNSYSSSNTQQPFSTNGRDMNHQTRQDFQAPARSGQMSQSKVQAHVQGWYQRVVLEAADRLRQTENYNSAASSYGNNSSAETYPMGSTLSDSPRQTSASASSTGNNSSRSNNNPVYHNYSPSTQGPRNANNSVGISPHSMPTSHPPSYHHYQQQQQSQSSYSQQANTNSSSYNSHYNNNSYKNSSPHLQYSASPTTSYPSTNRSFPSPPSHSETSNLQYQSHRQAYSNQGEPKRFPLPQDNYTKVQVNSHSNSNSSYHAPYNNEYNCPQNSNGRLEGGHLRYDPIHGSDV